ncbi:YybH family protein [Cerasicoccus frondis]|uniref:YybH family protein n=1 Tax=Cerasicoccus frondis TaxID=490090 RepID=UPI0028525583|nr:nuclear transport factor 2 family protein [Cerasicoccus frondis]
MLKHLLASLCLLTLASGLQAASGPQVLRATEEFYAALNAMFTGDVAPMEAVWSHDEEEATYMGPDGSYVVGWSKIKADWEKQAALKLGGKVTPTDIHLILGNGMAVVQCYEVGQNFDNEGKKVEVKIRATNVFRNINGEWKMVSHHTDLLPHLMHQH